MGLERFPVNLPAFLPLVFKVLEVYNDLHIPTGLQTMVKCYHEQKLALQLQNLPQLFISAWIGFI